jgi:hypothetical protein
MHVLGIEDLERIEDEDDLAGVVAPIDVISEK